MKRKILWLWVTFLLVAALVLASCGEAVPGEQEEEEEEEEEVTPVGEQEEEEEEEEEVEVEEGLPQYGGIITNFIGWEAEVPTADIGDRLWPTHLFITPILEHLIEGDFETYGPRGTGEWDFCLEAATPTPYLRGVLVDDWEVTAEEITFQIKSGIHWAAYGKEDVMESRELTPEDIVLSLDRYFDFDNGRNRTENGGFVDSVYAEGDTVVIATSKFNADWMRICALGHSNAIYAPETIEAGASDWNNLVGTGPFMFNEYVVGSHMSYVKNPDYHFTTTIDGVEYDIPFIDELIWPIIPDESTQIAALRTARLDLWYATPMKYIDTLEQTSPELNMKFWAEGGMFNIVLNNSKEPFNNRDVRRALMIAIDRPAVMNVLSPNGSLYAWPYFTGLPALTPQDELPAELQEIFVYDEDKARQMIIDAGYPDGIGGIEIAAVSREQNYVIMATMAAAYWSAIGVETTVRPMETTAHTAYVKAGDYQTTAAWANTSMPFRLLEGGYIPPTAEVPNNARYDNPYFTERYWEAAATVDPDARNAILKEIGVITIDDLPIIPVCGPSWATSWWPWVKNFYGEMEVSTYDPGKLMAYAWLDEDLKEDLGY